MSLNSIPLSELKHRVTIRHITADGTQDDYGQYVPTTSDFIENCHFEFHTYNDESERVKNKEFVLDYDLLLILPSNSVARQGDQIRLVTAKSGDTIFLHQDSNPMAIKRVFKIPADNGIHHVEAYCNFHHPQFNT